MMGKVVRFTITHHGVPVGTTEFTAAGERIVVGVRPLPGYGAIQPMVRAASVALAGVALGGGQSVESAALRRAAELGRALELRDEAGALVPVDYVELTEWPGGNPEVAAMLRLRDAHAAVLAAVHPAPRGASGASAPQPNDR
jgi:hypothetical protein